MNHKPTLFNSGLRVVGFDPSLRNWGIASGMYYPNEDGRLSIELLEVTQPVLPKGKQVRQNSLDLLAAAALAKAAFDSIITAAAVFVEVPVGSQSSRAMASYGICVGILGALRSGGTPFFELSPEEVKKASVGIKTATKAQMIEWAVAKHPEANWPTYKQHGEDVISEAKAEHMADAVATIYAGLSCQPFQQMLALIKRSAT